MERRGPTIGGPRGPFKCDSGSFGLIGMSPAPNAIWLRCGYAGRNRPGKFRQNRRGGVITPWFVLDGGKSGEKASHYKKQTSTENSYGCDVRGKYQRKCVEYL